MQHLQRIVQRKLLLWARKGIAERLIVARKRMRPAQIPYGVELIERKLTGKRVLVKGGRHYGNTRRISARWPQAGMHEAENVRFVCIVEGRVGFQVGNYLLRCSEGDIIIIPPRIPYPGDKYKSQLIESLLPGRPCTLLWMVQYRRGLQCYLSSYDNAQKQSDPRENLLFTNRQIIELFHLLTDEVLERKNELLCEGLFLAFVAALEREMKAEHYLYPGPMHETGAPKNELDSFVAQLEECIKKHLDRSLTTEQVAQELYMSRAQFVRRIRKETGKTFVEFLTDYRMQQAKILLQESEWTVQSIARYVGFKSSTYFHAFFLRREGCTPGNFRLKFQGHEKCQKKDSIK